MPAPSRRARAPVIPEAHHGEHERPARRGLQDHVVFARFGAVTLVTFGVFCGLGGLLAAWLLLAHLHQAGVVTPVLLAGLFVGTPLAIVGGARLLSIALDWSAFLDDPVRATFKPGFASQGGIAGGACALVATAWLAGLDVLLLLDVAALSGPLGHAIGRLGCLSYGCCHGAPTTSRLAIVYTNPMSKAVRHSGLGGVPLHPAPLYSALGNLALLTGLTLLVQTLPLPNGAVAALYLVLAAAGRTWVETLRGIPTSHALGLTPFQWLSVVQLLLAASVATAAATLGTPSPLGGPLGPSLVAVAGSPWPWVFGAVLTLCFGFQGSEIGSFCADDRGSP